MIENRFVSSENAFIDVEQWDARVDPTLGPLADLDWARRLGQA
jgi:hypothetical protein